MTFTFQHLLSRCLEFGHLRSKPEYLATAQPEKSQIDRFFSSCHCGYKPLLDICALNHLHFTSSTLVYLGDIHCVM